MTAREWINTNFEGSLLLADGYDDALLGWAYQPGLGTIAVYEANRCLEILQAQGMTEEEAQEYFSFNSEGCGGKGMPVYLWRIPEEALR